MDTETLPQLDERREPQREDYRPVLRAQVVSVQPQRYGVNTYTLRLDDGTESTASGKPKLVPGDHTVLVWEAGRQEGEGYVLRNHDPKDKPAPDDALLGFDESARRNYERTMEHRREQAEAEQDFREQYAALFGKGRVRRVVIESVHPRSGNLWCRDEDGKRIIVGFESVYGYSDADRYPPGTHGLAWDNSKDTRPHWVWGHVQDKERGATDQEWARLAERQLEWDRNLHEGKSFSTRVGRTGNYRERYAQRTLSEMAVALGPQTAKPFNPKSVYRKHPFMGAAGQVDYWYERFDVLRVAHKTVFVEAGVDVRVTRHSRRVRDVPDLKLNRRDLEIKGWAYGPGGSDTFVLEPPEAYQHHYYKTPPARGQRLTRTDHLVTLGLTDPVTDAQIKARYRSLARQHHPDVNPGDAEAEEMFKRVVAAYEALIPPGTRVAEEDVERAEAGSSPASPPPSSGPIAALETEGSASGVEEGPVGVSASVFSDVEDYMRKEGLDWNEFLSRALRMIQGDVASE